MRNNITSLLMVSFLLLVSCQTKKFKIEQSAYANATQIPTTVPTVVTEIVTDTTDYENATYYLVIADTSQVYAKLHKKMFSLTNQLHQPIDTMGRYYNKEKNSIVLPDDADDELYAGGYYPRRFPSKTLSLDYLNFYNDKAGEKTIALLAGIYESQTSADSALVHLKKIEHKAFTLKTKMYIRCMH
ncbi:hypothetical protein [Flavobacterium muglaense]|uniref:Lipoprotein n=1 Tax=Flavobacterium muglaense TaxID=2764716 RepID=A0A923MZ88_9FLAO|nr:hypothetical protein [Flavobacterium muglaense]MBC5836820.1 hypothetical protein [Flavobacterium muglaense]MBC5843230.1 hypothetical protein [Flavobacterium muglaense]